MTTHCRTIYESRTCSRDGLNYLSDQRCSCFSQELSQEDLLSKQQTPDEKVLDYLERAKKIEQKFTPNGVQQETFAAYQANVIEIAKLLQREESKL